MVPLLAQNAVKIKSDFTNACMTGNYECAYACGLFMAAAGLEEKENIVDIIQLHKEVVDVIEKIEFDNSKMKRLKEMFLEYEPSDKIDDQMIELYYVGFADKIV